jgi:sulfane dehydrogenase subunit SoxC
MVSDNDPKGTKRAASRRDFLKTGLLGGAAMAASAGVAKAARATRLLPKCRTGTVFWAMASMPRLTASPSEYESHVMRRDVPWLTADPVSSINFHAAARTRRHHHAERPLLRATSRRNGDDRSRRSSADDQRPGRYAAGVHDGRPEALPAGKPGLFPGMRGKFRYGMAGLTTQRLPVHAWHGPLRRLYRRAAEATCWEEAGVKTNGKWVLAEGADASAMTRSIPIEKALEDCLVAFKMNGEALGAGAGLSGQARVCRAGKAICG